MRTVKKTTITTVLLSVLLAPLDNAEARLKYYRYNDNLPMVEMSLNMMVAMGVLEPIPSRLVHDGNPYNRLATQRYERYSRYAYPTSVRYSGRSRYYDDYWDEPVRPYRSRYYRSRYGDWSDPWYQSTGDYWDGPWSSRWRGPGYNSWSSPWSSPWETSGYSPWGYEWNNPWNSVRSNRWNNLGGYQLLNPWSSPLGYLGGWPYTSLYPGYSLTPGTLPGISWPMDSSERSKDESKPAREPDQGQKKNGANGDFDKVRSMRPVRPAGAREDRGYYQRPGNTGYPRLNGLWIGNTGEMLGIRGNDFLWYDQGNRYAQGYMIKSPTVIQARIPETRTVVRFHYKLQGDELVILSTDGKTRIFNRMPLLQAQHASIRPRAAHSSYQPGTVYLHISRSKYQSGDVEPRLVYPRSDAAYASGNTGVARDGAAVVRAAYSRHAVSELQPSAKPQVVDEVQTDTDLSKLVEKPEDVSPGADDNDPYTYLFSYLKAADSVDAESGAADGDDAAVPVAAGQSSDRSNIWKPNDLFPDRRRGPSAAAPSVTGQGAVATAGPASAANGVNTFSWPQGGLWE